MPFRAHQFKHLSYPKAYALERHLNGIENVPDFLCRSAFPYPVADEICRQIRDGVGNVSRLHVIGFSAVDAQTLAAAIPSAGAFSAAVLTIVFGGDPSDIAAQVALGIPTNIATFIAAEAAAAHVFVTANGG